MVWRDHDANGVSEPAELESAESAGLLRISLDYVVAPVCDARGNCERERASFEWKTESGEVRVGAVVDVHLRVRDAICE